MIIFLYGPDTYRLRKKLNEIITHYKKIHKSGLNLICYEDKKLNYQEFKDGMKLTSMFKEKKLAVMTNSFSNVAFKENFLKEGKNFLKSEDIILFCQEGDVNEKDSLFKFLKKNAKSQEFKLLKGQKLKNWVKKEFENYEVKIETSALDKLINFVGSDLWRMTNEIKKLVTYRVPHAARRRDKSLLNLRAASPRSVGEGGKENEVLFDHKKAKTLKEEDIELLVRPKIETDIFKTIDAISQKNKKLALKLLHEHLEKGDSPLYLLTMINYQFRNLLIIKDLIEKHKPYNSILRKSGLHPFVVKKSYFQAQRFSFQELKKIYQKIFQVDLSIKTGRIEPEMSLDLLITRI